MTISKYSDLYWEKRIANNTWGVYNDLEAKSIELRDMYEKASQDIENSLFQLTKDIQIKGTVQLSDMHKYNRLTGLKKNIEDRIRILGEEAELFSKENMKKGGQDVYKNICNQLENTSFSVPNEKVMEMMYKTPWQGSNFSTRLWKNTQKLATNLNEILTVGITQGKTITEMALNLGNKMNEGFNVCHRLVRSETMHYLNESSMRSYIDSGVNEVKLWAAEDERVCEKCGALHGKKFPINKRPVLPLHANCRCTYIPVIDTLLDKVDNNIKPESEEEYISKYKDNILKNNKLLNSSDVQVLNRYLDGLDEGTLNLYSKLSEHFGNNQYYGGAGWYLPGKRKVEMDMRSNLFEKVTGKNEGAFQTKFHEEFHQLDHLLVNTIFGYDSTGKVNIYADISNGFTNVYTTIGSKMSNAIDTDILNLINKAIRWKNRKDGLNIKLLGNITRISKEARYSFVEYLKTNYNTQDVKARISILTDSIGLTTKDRISPYNFGYWGHRSQYNKDRGKSGATSETWASFGSMILRQDQEEINLMNELMPNMMETYTKALNQIIEYVKTNELTY